MWGDYFLLNMNALEDGTNPTPNHYFRRRDEECGQVPGELNPAACKIHLTSDYREERSTAPSLAISGSRTQV